MTGDLPQMAASNYTSTAYGLGGGLGGGGTTSNLVGMTSALTMQSPEWDNLVREMRGQQNFMPTTQQAKEAKVADKIKRRLVQVLIVDSNENVPLDQCLLYTGDQKLTDATDQELFFEIDIKGILAEHNTKRVKLVDKKVKERTEHLEAAKIRDLKMVVVTVAEF